MAGPHLLYNALIRHTIDLRELYRDAAAQAQEPGLRVVLGENTATLDLVIADLQKQLRRAGIQPATRGGLGGKTRRQLFEWLLPTGRRRDPAWIRHLATGEAALLQAFERGIQRTQTEAALVLRHQLPKLQGIHLDMHSLAHTG